MPTPSNKSNEIKRLCPECDSEVTLTLDEETGDREGRCPKCKIDVGAILNRDRYEKARERMRKEEEEEDRKKRKSSWL